MVLQAVFTELKQGDICGVKSLEALTEHHIEQLEKISRRMRKLEMDLHKLTHPEEEVFHPCMLSSQLHACDGLFPPKDRSPDRIEDLYSLHYAKGLQIREMRQDI